MSTSRVSQSPAQQTITSDMEAAKAPIMAQRCPELQDADHWEGFTQMLDLRSRGAAPWLPWSRPAASPGWLSAPTWWASFWSPHPPAREGPPFPSACLLSRVMGWQPLSRRNAWRWGRCLPWVQRWHQEASQHQEYQQSTILRGEGGGGYRGRQGIRRGRATRISAAELQRRFRIDQVADFHGLQEDKCRPLFQMQASVRNAGLIKLH